LCLVPSADGWVTALNAANGKVVWRFNVNVYGRKGVFQGQVEAAQPPTGGVLVHKETVYITGGRHTGLEGGCTLYGLQLATGKVLFEQKLDAERVVVGFGNLQGVPTAAVALDLLQTDMSGRYLIGEGFAVDTTKNEVAKLPTYGIARGTGPLRTALFKSGPQPLRFWEALIPCGGSRNGSYGKLLFSRFDTRDESRDFTYPGGGGREKPLGSFIVIHQNRLFVLTGGGKRGGSCQINCWPLNANHEIPEKPAWSVPYIKTFAGAAISGKDGSPRLAASIAAGNRLYLAGYDVDDRPFLDQINADTGKGIGSVPLTPDQAVTRHGLAVVQDRLYASTVCGHLLCIE
jgi:outer membrane protein assembly factor BamB